MLCYTATGCEFGDQAEEYCHTLTSGECYREDILKTCCATCDQFQEELYGDIGIAVIAGEL